MANGNQLPKEWEELKIAVQAGANFKYLHFWGRRQTSTGISKSCLSQWYPAPFVDPVDQVRYPTAEHYMMVGKARLFKDSAAETAILAQADPATVKALGRKVKGFDANIWDRECVAIVVRGSVLKFSSNPSLRRFLLSTQGHILVEASPLDAIWGIGMSADDPEANKPLRWRGPNLLGFALAEAREQLLSG